VQLTHKKALVMHAHARVNYRAVVSQAQNPACLAPNNLMRLPLKHTTSAGCQRAALGLDHSKGGTGCMC
jgi:hypothetical protein